MLSELSRKKLESLAEEVSQREGCQLYDIEFTSYKGQRILRVYVQGNAEGVSVDQCAEISRGLSLLLDVEDLVDGGHYDLEVSSPGLDRPLRLHRHFASAVGEKVKVKTTEIIHPLNRQLNKGEKVKGVTGKLIEVSDHEFVVETEKDKWEVPIAVVHKAHVIFEFEDKKNFKKRGS